MQHKNQQGFTIIEALAVAVIIAVLGGVSSIVYNSHKTASVRTTPAVTATTSTTRR
jgi:prepilin-type N-terminal cleavage/methylation domain-containing protein